MPSISFKSKVRTVTNSCALTMIVQHRLLVGQRSDIIHRMKQSPPEGVDIILASQLVITISGTLNGARVSPENIMASHIARHLVDYLRMNADKLGINAVSNGHISEDTGLLTLSCTGSRPFPISEPHPLQAKLAGFDIRYVWQTHAKSDSNQPDQTHIATAMNPFSRHLSLPYLTAVNITVERFVTFQLVKRYPLIFGTWCKQLDIETPFFSSIYASVHNIMERSPHTDFQVTCKKLLKLCRRRIEKSADVAFDALSTYIESAEGADFNFQISNDAEALKLSMERFYRLGMKRPHFKVLYVARSEHRPQERH
ncbi:hypothetical protein BDZ97DRAFT_567431 [Flammula alnicola]|nr:hypothetical protein BDZ97DRAFT_567431 [Flammula alnicola]